MDPHVATVVHEAVSCFQLILWDSFDDQVRHVDFLMHDPPVADAMTKEIFQPGRHWGTFSCR